MGIEEIKHTADIGLRVTGNSIEEIFSEAAKGVVNVAIEGKVEGEEEIHSFEFNGDTKEDLLVEWLNEVIYFLYEKGLVFKNLKKIIFEDKNVMIEAEFLKPENINYSIEVKSATYHNLKIEEKGNGFEATVIFDT
ncbi:MAG: hypothetical protein DRI36_05055 [Caldiserica bacterium]|nr:MAG: hypothetical protein DRI36_05055 [Caldisericota bacterium]